MSPRDGAAPSPARAATVEVVHRRSDRWPTSRSRRTGQRRRRMPQPGRMASRPAPRRSRRRPSPARRLPRTPPQVGHVMPGWEPLLTRSSRRSCSCSLPPAPQRQPRVAMHIAGAPLCRSLRCGGYRRQLFSLRLLGRASTREPRPHDLRQLRLTLGFVCRGSLAIASTAMEMGGA